ncbi:hypothetical protein DAI22_06g198200 [Oryza sativa Japonica Group]|nr:hypothetical protein DAI22_06g198200 [Oryza sativa Japonica Group]
MKFIHSPIPRKSAISGQRQPATAAPRRARSSHTAAAGHPLAAAGISIQQWRTAAAGAALCGDQCLVCWRERRRGHGGWCSRSVWGCAGDGEAHVAAALERERRGS